MHSFPDSCKWVISVVRESVTRYCCEFRTTISPVRTFDNFRTHVAVVCCPELVPILLSKPNLSSLKGRNNLQKLQNFLFHLGRILIQVDSDTEQDAYLSLRYGQGSD